MRAVLIIGSSRSDGDTTNLTTHLLKKTDWETIDLNDYDFGYFDYQHSNINDDYLGLMRRIIDTYDTLIFVTPVYWYSMSGIMKVFFDRITDLLTIEKELGRRLSGKDMAVISCSNGNNLGNAFWLPFSETAAYLGMGYLGNVHAIAGEIDELELNRFINAIKRKASLR